MTNRAISSIATLGYAMGSFGTGVFSTVPAVLLLYFCTETLHISGSVAAALILLPKIWSIIWDPLVGRWSDRSMNPWGRRRPFMVAGIIGMVIAFIVLFNVPDLGAFETIVWVGLSYFALATLYSLFAVPYIAIPAQVSVDQTTLARLISWRMVMVMVGILVGASGAPMLIEAGGGGRAGYGVMGWWIGSMCLIVMALPLLMLRGRDYPATTREDGKESSALFNDMIACMANRRFQRLAFAYLLQATAFGAVSAVLPYVITKGLGQSDRDIGTALVVYLLATIVAVPLWSWTGKRIGLHAALKWAALSYAAGVVGIGALVLLRADWPIALVLLALAGIPFAGLQVIPFTLVGEVIRTEGADAEGRYTGIWTAVEKLGLSLGPALVGIALSLAAADIISGIGVFLCLVPPILCVSSMIFLSAGDDLLLETDHG
jgi:glycoside/pentoside/hexuronide:cation symporter, GPH family